MTNQYISANEVIGLVPDELLDQLSNETRVDYSVKKLQGKVIFKLFLYALLNNKTISLRMLAAIYNSEKFKNLFNLPNNSIKHSGLGFRLATIDYHYFERIFCSLVHSNQVDSIMFAGKEIIARKIDSTLVTLSSKLLKLGLAVNPEVKELKFGVEINQGIPVNIILFKKQKYLSEDKALPQLIRAKTQKKGLNIAIFDRGVQNKKSFVRFNNQGIYFISRLKTQKYEVSQNLPLTITNAPELTIISDQLVRFSNSRETINTPFRIIVGQSKKDNQIISFITNVDFLEANEITQLYKSRWEIETFFKFIKQELNFKHLLSRTENGIKVVMYLTMIAAILLTIYKKVNKIVGWAVAKIKFMDELESDIMRNWHFELIPVFQTSRDRLFPTGLGGS